jgi:hypothetical protein
MNRFRCLLVSWDKKPENPLAFLHFACGLIAFRAAGLFGQVLSIQGDVAMPEANDLAHEMSATYWSLFRLRQATNDYQQSDAPSAQEVFEEYRKLIYLQIAVFLPLWWEADVSHAPDGTNLPTAKPLADRLVQAGLAEWAEDFHNQRPTVRFTGPGEKLLKGLLASLQQAKNWLQELNEEELAALKQGLQALMRVACEHSTTDGNEEYIDAACKVMQQGCQIAFA